MEKIIIFGQHPIRPELYIARQKAIARGERISFKSELPKRQRAMKGDFKSSQISKKFQQS